jgi:hypothetical protein
MHLGPSWRSILPVNGHGGRGTHPVALSALQLVSSAAHKHVIQYGAMVVCLDEEHSMDHTWMRCSSSEVQICTIQLSSGKT